MVSVQACVELIPVKKKEMLGKLHKASVKKTDILCNLIPTTAIRRSRISINRKLNKLVCLNFVYKNEMMACRKMRLSLKANFMKSVNTRMK